MLRKALLLCGVVSLLLYIVIDILAGLRYDGYSYTSQTISELSAIDAPSRSLAFPLVLVYTVLLIAFGVGVWKSAGRSRALRVVGVTLVAHGVFNLVLAPFSAMHRREVLAAGGGTVSDTLHLVVGSWDMLCTLTAIGFGAAAALGGRFRLYSIATFVILVVFGTLTFLKGSGVAANEPTPWIGVYERIVFFGFMLWTAVLSIVLLRVPVEQRATVAA